MFNIVGAVAETTNLRSRVAPLEGIFLEPMTTGTFDPGGVFRFIQLHNHVDMKVGDDAGLRTSGTADNSNGLSGFF